MDQLKKVGQFLWKHRFWFSLGLALLLALYTYPSGAQRLVVAANQRRMQLDNVYNGIKSFVGGAEHPNQEAIDAATAKKDELAKTIDGVWEKIYAEQQKLMTWPKEVAELFAQRPFGSDLSDRENRFLIVYQRAFPAQLDEIYYELDPLEQTDEGNVVGVIEADKSVLHGAVWTRTPLSMEAWQAQEELWIQRAILKAIRKANEGAKNWREASIKRLIAIGIGPEGLDANTVSTASPLLDKTGQPASTGTAGGGGGGEGGGMPGTPDPNASLSQGVNPFRYISVGEYYRVVPVYVSMLVDQMQIPRVLGILSSADFNFTIQQVNITLPAEGDVMPPVLIQTGALGRLSPRDNAIFGTMQLEVWGRMRIYETPTRLKAEYDAKMNPQGAAQPAAAPAEQN
ncbi:MAG: hypothetical protein U1D30_02675 [Planctomycetota bacterium]